VVEPLGSLKNLEPRNAKAVCWERNAIGITGAAKLITELLELELSDTAFATVTARL